MFRDPLSLPVRRSETAAPVAMTAPSFRTPQLPLWPSGIARYDDGILEITAGDGLRVAVRDVVEIDLVPALGARLVLRLRHRSGFDAVERSYWVAVADHDHLRRLVTTVRGAMTMCA